MDDNLEWLTQKTEDLKSNKGNLAFPTHTVNEIELSGNKKVAIPPFLHDPPFQIYPALIRRGGGGGVPTMRSVSPKLYTTIRIKSFNVPSSRQKIFTK